MLDIANFKYDDPTNPYHGRAEKKNTTETSTPRSTLNFSFQSKENEKKKRDE